MTINETSFFRESRPDRRLGKGPPSGFGQRQRGTGPHLERRVRNGEEPYSIAMLLWSAYPSGPRPAASRSLPATSVAAPWPLAGQATTIHTACATHRRHSQDRFFSPAPGSRLALREDVRRMVPLRARQSAQSRAGGPGRPGGPGPVPERRHLLRRGGPPGDPRQPAPRPAAGKLPAPRPERGDGADSGAFRTCPPERSDRVSSPTPHHGLTAGRGERLRGQLLAERV